MSSATLALRNTYATGPSGTVATTVAASAGFAASYLGASRTPHWLRRPGAAGTLLIHALALLTIWTWSGSAVRPELVPPVVELIRIQPEPRPELTPPRPEPVKEKPVVLAPPRPAVQAQPVPKTVEAPAAQAETITPPAPPVHVAPPGPVTPAPPTAVPTQAAPAAPAPKQISTEGIPTDYVSQVYARINRNADYPREARMRRQQGKVGYRLTLNPDGALVSFDIQSSGVEALDEAARDAIRRAAPFPRLPELGGSSYLLSGNIVFKIN
jgi:protein TonB